MKITPIKTDKILPNAMSVLQLIDSVITDVNERSILVVTSKVVSLCENRVVPVEDTDRQALIRSEADYYYDYDSYTTDKHLYNFTIKQNTLIPASGIDVSNGNGSYILWPKNSVETAEEIRAHLISRFHLREVGVIITDSTISLSRWGTLGIAIGHSGFEAIKDYVGQPDLFGRNMHLSKANVAGGLASSAVVTMGEGAERTPIALIEDLPFVQFQRRHPSKAELDEYYISPLNDEPFMPFFNPIHWRAGGHT